MLPVSWFSRLLPQKRVHLSSPFLLLREGTNRHPPSHIYSPSPIALQTASFINNAYLFLAGGWGNFVLSRKYGGNVVRINVKPLNFQTSWAANVAVFFPRLLFSGKPPPMQTKNVALRREEKDKLRGAKGNEEEAFIVVIMASELSLFFFSCGK